MSIKVKAKCTGINTWGMGDTSETHYTFSFGTEKSKMKGTYSHTEQAAKGAKPAFEHGKEYTITVE